MPLCNRILDMKTSVKIQCPHPPVVELDSEAHAAYIRFNNRKVARTQPLHTDGCVITVDLDAHGEVIGIELVGVDEFGLEPLMKKAGMQAFPKRMMDRARYVPANSQMMVAGQN